ncbi:MAG: helix-turn-helix domain-containing protein [Alphaproteobacteria bacterium]
MPKPVSSWDARKIWIELNQGATPNAVAKKHRVSESTTRRIARGAHPATSKFGAAKKGHGKNRPLAKTTIHLVIGMYTQKIPIVEIERQTGVSRSSINRIIKGKHRLNRIAVPK